jgi:hypothetical protein
MKPPLNLLALTALFQTAGCLVGDPPSSTVGLHRNDLTPDCAGVYVGDAIDSRTGWDFGSITIDIPSVAADGSFTTADGYFGGQCQDGGVTWSLLDSQTGSQDFSGTYGDSSMSGTTTFTYGSPVYWTGYRQ